MLGFLSISAEDFAGVSMTHAVEIEVAALNSPFPLLTFKVVLLIVMT